MSTREKRHNISSDSDTSTQDNTKKQKLEDNDMDTAQNAQDQQHSKPNGGK